MFNPATPYPPEPGLYEVQPPISTLRTGTRFYAHWSGVAWSPCSRSREKASDPLRLASIAVVQNKPWKPLS